MFMVLSQDEFKEFNDEMWCLCETESKAKCNKKYLRIGMRNLILSSAKRIEPQRSLDRTRKRVKKKRRWRRHLFLSENTLIVSIQDVLTLMLKPTASTVHKFDNNYKILTSIKQGQKQRQRTTKTIPSEIKLRKFKFLIQDRMFLLLNTFIQLMVVLLLMFVLMSLQHVHCHTAQVPTPLSPLSLPRSIMPSSHFPKQIGNFIYKRVDSREATTTIAPTAIESNIVDKFNRNVKTEKNSSIDDYTYNTLSNLRNASDDFASSHTSNSIKQQKEQVYDVVKRQQRKRNRNRNLDLVVVSDDFEKPHESKTKRNIAALQHDNEAPNVFYNSSQQNKEDVINAYNYFQLNNYTHNYSDPLNASSAKSLATQSDHNENILRLVMEGLGLKKLPDMKKLNISQREYSSKYQEYLQRVYYKNMRLETGYQTYASDKANDWSDWKNGTKHRMELDREPLLVTLRSNSTATIARNRAKRDVYYLNQGLNDLQSSKSKSVTRSSDAKAKHGQKTRLLLNFVLNEQLQKLQTVDIQEANLRLMLVYNPTLGHKFKKRKRKLKHKKLCLNEAENEKHPDRVGNQTTTTSPHQHRINLKIFQMKEPKERHVLLDTRQIEFDLFPVGADFTQSQWLEFDATKAVHSSLREQQMSLKIMVQCENCLRVGARILNEAFIFPATGPADDDSLAPVLNVITRPGRLYPSSSVNPYMATGNFDMSSNVDVVNSCQHADEGDHNSKPRCCRHQMQVVFKEIKGFEFIIYPKVFDAGYCSGRCPPRHNPAHHHAMLQSLIWKQSKGLKAPRPCCAPSKLVELEVLHVDEMDSTKLKISTWTDMRVVECACS